MAQAPSSDDNRRTILLVEDEALIALSESQTLERHGYRVLTAFTGEQAAELAVNDSEIELVLMDINLGSGIDGTQAAEIILSARDLPIAFLSSHTEPEVVEKTEKITSYGYIVKNSGETVLTTSVKMAFRLFDSRKLAGDTFRHSMNGLCVHRMLYDEAGDPVDCEYLRVNDAFEQHTGLPARSVVGQTIRELYPDEEAQEVIDLYAGVVSSGEPIRHELYFQPIDRWFQLSIFPTRYHEFTVVIQNITARKHAEQVLAAEKEWLNVTLQSVGDAVMATNVDGKVVVMNTVAEKLTGWSTNEAEGRPLCEVLHIVSSITRRPCESPVDRVIQNGEIVGLANHTSLISADGSEYQIADSAAPIKDSHGEVIGVVLVFRDVTEEYRIAQALSDSERDMARAQSMAQLGSWRFDLDSRHVVASNQARKIYGLGDEALTIVRAQTLPLPDYRPMLDAALQALVEKGSPYDVEFEIRRPSDGAVRSIHSIAEYDADHHRVIGTIQDITERTRAEQTVRGLVEEKERALKESHHRVTNNMGIVESLLSLHANALSDPSASQAVREAASRVQSMNALYNRLYRRDAVDPMSVREFLPPLADDIAEVLGLTDALSVDIDADDTELDPKTLQTVGIVINELMTNSVKHAFAGMDDGRARVTASQCDSRLVIVYEDNGPGLSDGVPSDESSGFGMQLVEAMIGHIGGTTSVETDGGMRVTVTIPCPVTSLSRN